MKRRNTTWGFLTLIMISVMACTLSLHAQEEPEKAPPAEKKPDVIIGAKDFAESELLAYMGKVLLKEKAGLTAEIRSGIPAGVILDQLSKGEIDLYVEYTGTAFAKTFDRSPEGQSRDAIHKQVSASWQTKHKVVWLPHLGFDNTFAVVMRRATAEQLGVKSIGDVAKHREKLSIAVQPDFLTLKHGYPHLIDAYGLKFKGEPAQLETKERYDACRKGDVDVIVGFATDGWLADEEFTVLKDEKKVFPPCEAAFVVRQGILKERPKARDALNTVAGKLTTSEMRDANAQVVIEAKKAEDVAREFLAKAGLIQVAAAKEEEGEEKADLKEKAAAKEEEAKKAEQEAEDLEKLAGKARMIAEEHTNVESRIQADLKAARAELLSLRESGASQADISKVEKRIAALEQTLATIRGEAAKDIKEAEAAEAEAKTRRTEAEKKRTEAQEYEEAHRHRQQFIAIGVAVGIVVVTLLIVRLGKRAIHRKELFSLEGIRDQEKIDRIRTPFLMMQRLFAPIVYFVGVIIALLQFQSFRRLGTAFFASAGVAGIVVGMAARSTLANAVAGVMLAFSQPIRVGDTVVIGEEYGTIEEIGLMYTTFKTWDNRRVMIPNEIMSNKEVVNYSIRDRKIWAKVPIHLDYSADVAKAREVLVDIVKQSENWNGQDEPVVWFMELGQQTIVLWAAAWADDPKKAWGLKCDILDNALRRFREEDIALPRRRYQYDGVRVTLEPGKGPDGAEAPGPMNRM